MSDATYRREMAVVFAKRALRQAAGLAGPRGAAGPQSSNAEVRS